MGPAERTSFGLGEQVLDIAVACKIARESAVLVLHVGTRRPVVKVTEKVVGDHDSCMMMTNWEECVRKWERTRREGV